MPDSSFAVLCDHAREAVCGIVPVAFDRRLRRIRLSVRDGVGDHPVLFDGRRELVQQNVDIEPSIPFRLGLDGMVERHEPRTGCTLDVGLMKLVIEIEQSGGRAPALRRDCKRLVDFTEVAGELPALVQRQTGRLPGREPFEMPDDEKDLAAVFLGERGNDQSLITRAPHRSDKPFLL